MIYFHDFQMHVLQYADLGRGNVFPEIDCCPMCQAQNRLYRHGFYARNAIETDTVVQIPICRLRCPDCGKTLSIFPVFLLPYFQYTLPFILQLLFTFLSQGQTLGARQLRQLYVKRFLAKQTEIALFVREAGNREPRTSSTRIETVRLLEKIRALGTVSFVRQWWRQRTSSFIAAADYRGTRVVPLF